MILEHEWPVGLMNIGVYSSLMVKLQWAHWLFSCLEYDNLQFEQTTVSSISSVIVLVINTTCYCGKELSVNYVTRQKNVQMYLCWLQKRNWGSFWTKFVFFSFSLIRGVKLKLDTPKAKTRKFFRVYLRNTVSFIFWNHEIN